MDPVAFQDQVKHEMFQHESLLLLGYCDCKKMFLPSESTE